LANDIDVSRNDHHEGVRLAIQFIACRVLNPIHPKRKAEMISTTCKRILA